VKIIREIETNQKNEIMNEDYTKDIKFFGILVHRRTYKYQNTIEDGKTKLGF
jgi:hypothetical protein